MYMYIYICIYIYMYIYVYIYIYIYVYTYIRIYICVCVYVSMGLCTYVRGVSIFAFVRAGCYILVAPACKSAVGNSKSPP